MYFYIFVIKKKLKIKIRKQNTKYPSALQYIDRKNKMMPPRARQFYLYFYFVLFF